MIAECLLAEFRIEGDDCPLARATSTVATTVAAEPPQLRSDGNVLLRFSAPQDEALTAALDGDSDIRYLHRTRRDETANYRCLSKHPCVVHELVDAGFLVESMRYRRGGATMRGAVVGHDVLRGVMAAAGRTVGVTLRQVSPLRSDDSELVERGLDLTTAQAEAVRVAYDAGYFELPRTATAAEVAAELDISKSAFLERLRRAQASVFGSLFEHGTEG
jgi:predicted DNA binding protein